MSTFILKNKSINLTFASRTCESQAIKRKSSSPIPPPEDYYSSTLSQWESSKVLGIILIPICVESWNFPSPPLFVYALNTYR